MPSTKIQRDDEHSDLLNFELCPLDYSYTLDCYLLPLADGSVNLHHAYMGDEDISELLTERVVDDLQRKAENLWEHRIADAKREAAMARAGL